MAHERVRGPEHGAAPPLVAGIQLSGFVSAVSISALTFTEVPNAAAAARDIFGIDDIQIAAIGGTAVPAPSTVILLSAGLLTLGGVAARRRHA